ncbi:MAG: SDR family oxidoreductase [Proteobacteria bacterium]|nr:SDR family oxidoreductase [Pseudomonadota bacterium]
MTSFASYPSLRDRAVLVSGGATGIGAALVEHFVAQGSKVGFLDIDEPAGRGLAARLGDAALFLPCDLRDTRALHQAAETTAARLGPVTVLVNNAARDDRHAIAAVTPEFWDERMAVNLRHQFFLAQAVAPGMKASGGGSIINFSSVSWMLAIPNMPVYLTAKAAVVGLTRALARDLGPDRIRVNAVVPGWIMTERQVELWLTPDSERALFEAQCLKEKLYPADVARLVLWLAADDSRMATAQNFVIDGGWT